MKPLRILLASVEKFTGNQWIRLTVSGILIATVLSEVVEDVFDIRAHNVLLVFGVFNLFRTLPDLFHGASVFEKAERIRSLNDWKCQNQLLCGHI